MEKAKYEHAKQFALSPKQSEYDIIFLQHSLKGNVEYDEAIEFLMEQRGPTQYNKEG
jgi:hypothetical protein